MSLRHLIVAAATLSCAVAGLTAPASAQTHQDSSGTHAHKSVMRPKIAVSREACTKTGCQPLPPGCSTTMEQTWSGPTGYEIIHCP